MTAKITFFPVANGDMTLVRLADTEKTSILIDMNIRQAADNPDEETYDVATALRQRLQRDANGRPYVDVLLLSHPDKDHCTGLSKHFYLGDLDNYPDDKKADAEKRIVIREMWSSPIVFRRASKNHTLCDDAKAFNTEAKRRVKVNRNKHFHVSDGDRILLLGEDENGKTEDLRAILIRPGEKFSKIRGQYTHFLEALLIAPFPKTDDDTEEVLSKNHSSVILNLKIAASWYESDGCHFLTGGDAEVAIWERVWEEYRDSPEKLEYDLLQAPHHCSWHTLSYDSWSAKGEDAVVSTDARSALSQARENASIVSSSKPIRDDDSDPPCIRAKREYLDILKNKSGIFRCTGEYPKTNAVKPLEFEVNKNGGISIASSAASAPTIITSSPTPRAGSGTITKSTNKPKTSIILLTLLSISSILLMMRS